MSVEFKDYYAVLGVPRDASEDAIKKAFRKLAREHHPDVARDKKAAEEKFKEINEAYEVLGDPEKRKRYDELGSSWRQDPGAFQQKARRRRRPKADDFEFHFGGSTGFSDFFEQFFGRANQGFSAEDFAGIDPFGMGGNGMGHSAARGRDVQGDLLVTLDEVMNGSQRTVSLEKVNSRTGERRTQTLRIRVPAGVREGQTIRVHGQGEEGPGGAQGSDLIHELHVAPWDAVLGATVSVPTLSGRVNLRIPPGSAQSQRLRVRGQGLPKEGGKVRGDLYVVLKVQVPQQIGDQERRLWEELRRISRFNPRP
jgi:curved DNA-binding protein